MLYDAHNHLQDERLDPWREQIIPMLPQTGLAEMIVNGSSEEDWPAVAELAREHAFIRPAFGLHPWYVKERSSQWSDTLRQLLMEHPHAVVGEIGLDRWIENPDIDAQLECLRTQLALAVELDRPATLHCLRAFGLLEETLRKATLPRRGFLLHSYGGPAEMIPGFVKLGAYFSLSPYFGHPRKAAQLAVFKDVPLDRLLAETDAPDMWPPEELNPHPLHSADGKAINHPANLRVSYDLLAQVRGMEVAELEKVIATNYNALFGTAR
ncbi:MAG: TatD family hydrolase [Prosthecobacter sp.]|uniref:TatD family hydrolase n=1 Tax=Prosthecobacter sp. TaxID=1965333 RepID=UPI0025F24EF3|nr:TatD family hydrolase [Prosthecobacter sp.]MCF7784667.1 TatD family hydrolase [Prosthecobacter sp.]